MKRIKLLLGLGLCLIVTSVWAQQDPMYSLYMTNPVTINPSIAGVRKVPGLSLVYRNQWVGLDGAPVTTSISYQTPMNNNKVGLAGSLIHDRLGPVAQTGLYLNYAYHLSFDDMGRRRLALGLMGGFNYYSFDLLSLRSNQPDDDIMLDGLNNKFLPNFGVGMFYNTPSFFFGASLPKLLRNSLSEKDNSLGVEDREERHMFLMTGVVIGLTQDIKFKPSAIGRIVDGSPASLDLTGTVMLYDKVWLGGMYRVGSSWGALARWQVSNKLHLGYSFDMATTRIKAFNKGTHEIFIGFDFVSDDIVNSIVRFF